MSNPFGTSAVDFAPAGEKFAEPITFAQRKALRAMMLEKAKLKGLDLQQADDQLDTWLAELTKERASYWIRETGRWLDAERLRRGISRYLDIERLRRSNR